MPKLEINRVDLKLDKKTITTGPIIVNVKADIIVSVLKNADNDSPTLNPWQEHCCPSHVILGIESAAEFGSILDFLRENGVELKANITRPLTGRIMPETWDGYDVFTPTGLRLGHGIRRSLEGEPIPQDAFVFEDTMLHFQIEGRG
jgi:hypothetical protein